MKIFIVVRTTKFVVNSTYQLFNQRTAEIKTSNLISRDIIGTDYYLYQNILLNLDFNQYLFNENRSIIISE